MIKIIALSFAAIFFTFTFVSTIAFLIGFWYYYGKERGKFWATIRNNKDFEEINNTVQEEK